MNLILGTANFCNDYGKRLEKDECFRILDRAKELGIWALDTAQSYGNSSKIIQEWSGNLPIFTKILPGQIKPGYANYILDHHEHSRSRISDGCSYYTPELVSHEYVEWVQAPFNPTNYSFKRFAHLNKFIARSIFCGGKLQRSNKEDIARLCFGFLKSHDVKNCVFGVESIEELELNVRIANGKL